MYVLTIILSIGYVSDTANCGYFDQVEPVTEVDEYRRIGSLSGFGHLTDKVIVVYLGNDHAWADVESNGDPPHVRLRRHAGDGAD